MRALIPKRKVVRVQRADKVSLNSKVATFTFGKVLTLECGHKIRESGWGPHSHDLSLYPEQKCRECHKAAKAAQS